MGSAWLPLAAALLAGVLHGGARLCAAETVTIHEVQNDDPLGGPPGAKPYEMMGRKEERAPLVSFASVSGWEVEGHDAEGWLCR